MKYLIAGLGNIGLEYANTRHNIGFDILDALAGASNISFKDKRYGFVSEMKYRARTYVLLKPSTFMNLSGNAIRYWLKKEKLPVENLLVVVDDIALPFGRAIHHALEHHYKALLAGGKSPICSALAQPHPASGRVTRIPSMLLSLTRAFQRRFHPG